MDYIDPQHAQLYEAESLRNRISQESRMNTQYIAVGNELVEILDPATALGAGLVIDDAFSTEDILVDEGVDATEVVTV